MYSPTPTFLFGHPVFSLREITSPLSSLKGHLKWHLLCAPSLASSGRISPSFRGTPGHQEFMSTPSSSYFYLPWYVRSTQILVKWVTEWIFFFCIFNKCSPSTWCSLSLGLRAGDAAGAAQTEALPRGAWGGKGKTTLGKEYIIHFTSFHFWCVTFKKRNHHSISQTY